MGDFVDEDLIVLKDSGKNTVETSKYKYHTIKDDQNNISFQDLFPDNDQLKDSVINISNVTNIETIKNKTDNSSTISSYTPILYSKLINETPGKAIVPRTPIDLLPFITKTNMSWTSDMETPENKFNEKSKGCNEITNIIDNNKETPQHRNQRTPTNRMKKNKMDVTSPILGGKKRYKRQVKRRILNNILDIDTNNEFQSSYSSNSDKLPSETMDSISNEVALDIEIETKKSIERESNNLISEICKEKRNIMEEKSPLINKANEIKSTASDKPLKKQIFDEKENSTMNISNNILERVATIRRNQKPFRQSIKAHVVVSKDIFTKSVRDLEFADLGFKQETTNAINAESKPLKHSLTKLSSFEKETNIANNKLSGKKNEIEDFSQFVPIEIMDDWDVENVLDIKKENTSLQNLPDSCNQRKFIKEDVNFNTANGKEILVSEEFLEKGMKIYNEIADELISDNNFLNLKHSNANVNSSKRFSNGLRNDKTLINNKETLFDTTSCNNLLSLNNFNNETNKLSTAINENTYNELKNNENISNISELHFQHNYTHNSKISSNDKVKKNEDLYHKNICNQAIKTETNFYQELPLQDFPEQKFITQSVEDFDNNSFTTAGGKGIKINEDKENYYLEIFQQLGDDIQDGNHLLNIKKNTLSKINRNIKSLDKVSVTFNKPRERAIQSKLNNNNNTNNNKVDGKIIIAASNSKHVLNKLNDTSAISKNKEKNSTVSEKAISFDKESFSTSGEAHKIIKNDPSPKKMFEKEKPLENFKIHKSEHNDRYMKKLKQKLDHCEIKRPERCRSFGGFSKSEEGAMTLKLNKSDPIEESFTNQPLKNGLSISQCFDSHSDSWLSKVEISHLNNSKVQSPVLIKKIEEKVNASAMPENCIAEERSEFLGFSFKECTENFRKYANFKKFLKNLSVDNCSIELNMNSGQSVSLRNETSIKQRLLIKCKCNIDVKDNYNESNYILTDIKSKTDMNKFSNKHEAIVKQNHYKIEKIEKRKHVDTDSDTPLSTLKKPRVGCEFQGRKLFCDELNDEDDDIVDRKKNEKSLSYLNAPTLIDQEHKDLLKKRLQAILHQEKIIKNKKRIKIHFSMGTLLRQRLMNNKNRISLSDYVGHSAPTVCSVDQIKQHYSDANVLDVTASNATCYKFLLSDVLGNERIVSLDVDDGGVIIFDENGHAGVSEFTKSFLALPGVDPKLLPTGWIENHYKWIIWKLASLDRIIFNTIKLPKILTPERVMKELKYRYDREIDKAERSALRRILEKDDVSTRRMVLCISSIKWKSYKQDEEINGKALVGLSQIEIEAMDGWYSIPLTIDTAMAHYVATGKIKEGTKIITYGAELLECPRGYFPLEKPVNVSLRICTNCTRRVRWNTKLGYQKNSRPIPVKLRSIVPTGGMIGETTAVVARTYPPLYREKTANGQSIYRNARSEEKAASDYERSLESKVDAMYAEAEKNFESKKTSESDDEMENSSQSKVRTRNQSQWQRNQSALKAKLETRMRQDLPPPRQVTSILKIRLFHDKTTAILSLWGGNEDSRYDIKEGDTITVYNSFATGTRGGELNLTTNRITHIKKESLLKLPYPNRICSLIAEIGSPDFQPAFNEIDTVGVVVSLGVAPSGMKNFEMVNLGHPKPSTGGSAYLSILFWNGLSAFGYQGILTVGSLVACSNLEWRSSASLSLPVAYCTEKSLFSCHPRQPYLAKELRNLKALVQNPATYAENCAEEVARELSKRSLQPWSRQVGLASPWTPGSQEMRSPGGPSVQRRLEKLSRYGCSTDGSPSVVLNDSSDRVKRDFTPVTRGKS
ncbi:PREDICTED: breast cancer type 2 susceptibility protein homolog [Ceratosolen solmsi marchali]|uniref:Breast cancer type 2 susceptibility protein homolog n=1 Tax=Ceratosolen solmsi marchali TaxID=326594 RepID=A0AAJ6YCY9_9HYME|nr:PREDICTED: breast cancer type 2 susceptibility protein homolog [Ceratosolen solmsi marchali]